MKWVNLAERQPDFPLHKFIVRVIGTNSHILPIRPNWYKIEWGQLVLDNRDIGGVWKLEELEWLDEYEDDLKVKIEALPRYDCSMDCDDQGTRFADMFVSKGGSYLSYDQVLKLLQ